MSNFYMLRLGAESETDIRTIDSCHRENLAHPFEIHVRCKQVPQSVAVGDFAVIWLGTNNNKGGRTPWVQGVRALGVIIGLSGEEGYNNEKTVSVSVGVVLNQSLTKMDFVNQTRVPYKQLATMPVLGVNNYSSQVIQRIDTSQPLDLFLAVESLHPGFLFDAQTVYPSLDWLSLEQADASATVASADLEPPDFDAEDLSETGVMTKPWNPNDIRITTKSFTVRELFTQISEGELDLAPDFQRDFVWKENQQVRLVESILLGIPLPAFYFNQDNSGAHQVIDGVQRLTTIRHFMSDALELKEEFLEYLGPLKGSKYSTLDSATKRRFASTQVVAHVIEPQTPDEVKYDIFNRVNTGGSPLSAQEIRHCMSKTRSREFLRRLVEKQCFDQIMGGLFWKREPTGQLVRDNKRMADREIALRFCAFYTVPIEEYAPSLDRFLLDFTHRLDKAGTLDLETIEAAFERAMKNCYAILGSGAFRRWPIGSNRRGPLNRAIFESQAVALANYPLEVLLPHKEAIHSGLRNLFSDPEYDNAVRFGTGDYRKVEQRMTTPREVLDRILT